MCGIVGILSNCDITNKLVEGLLNLEYRGYDSCGIAIQTIDKLYRIRSTKRILKLTEQIIQNRISGFMGIAHTRWATHGKPNTNNSHPHFSNFSENNFTIALAHNGIIENCDEISDELCKLGYTFSSQTDTEVVAHLIHYLYNGDILKSVQEITKLLRGAYSIIVFSNIENNRLIGIRKGSPLIIGYNENKKILSSDIVALSKNIENIIHLEEGDIIEVNINNIKIIDSSRSTVKRNKYNYNKIIKHDELKSYNHYMQKEIFEQPIAMKNTLQNIQYIHPNIFGNGSYKIFQKINKILILACGTSYYAGMTAKYWIESIAKIPVSVEIASEYIYRYNISDHKTLVVTISQSGETADTLSALKHARGLGMIYTLTVCNVLTSSIVRESLLSYITHAGIEIGVASTKAFTTQLAGLFLLSLSIAKSKKRLNINKEHEYVKELHDLPISINKILLLHKKIIKWSKCLSDKENILFLGRGIHYPIALEGALKLKEVSYIHAEAYPAGELKHGPLALVTKKLPVITIAPNNNLSEKIKSNIQEVSARGGNLYIFTDVNSKIKEKENIHVINMPENYKNLSPILYTIPLQLLAYYTACFKGTDVDKPRNLAKSVTVE